MIPYFAKNGVIKNVFYLSDEFIRPSDTYLVIEIAKIPRYREEILKPLNKLYRDQSRGSNPSSEIEIDGLFGAHYRPAEPISKIEEGKLIYRLAEQFQLWNLPFLPYKERKKVKGQIPRNVPTLEVLLNTFKWARKGKIYAPDRIEFYGTLDDFKRVVEFYGGTLPAR